MPSCLVITQLPSAAISAIGKPSGRAVAGQVEEAGEVAAGGLGAALDDVTGDHGTGQLVVLLGRPAEPPDRRPDHDRGVGDPPGDHDVGAGLERAGDAERAEVGVGGERPGEAELGGARGQVVAVDPGDLRRESLLVGDLAQLLHQPGRVEATGVGDDAARPSPAPAPRQSPTCLTNVRA